MTDTDEVTTAEIRRMLAVRYAQRNWRGVWFWGTWLLMRWHITSALYAIGGAVAGVALVLLTVALFRAL